MIKSNYFQRLFIPFVYTVSTSILRDGTRIQFVQLFPSGLHVLVTKSAWKYQFGILKDT